MKRIACWTWDFYLRYDGLRPYCLKNDRLSVFPQRSEEHTSELQSQSNLVCRLLLEKKKQSLLSPPAATAASSSTSRYFAAASSSVVSSTYIPLSISQIQPLTVYGSESTPPLHVSLC